MLDKWLSAVINFKSSLRTRDCPAKCSTGKDTSERMMPEKKVEKKFKKLLTSTKACDKLSELLLRQEQLLKKRSEP